MLRLYPQALKAHTEIQELKTELRTTRIEGTGQRGELFEAEREIRDLRHLLSTAEHLHLVLNHKIDGCKQEGAQWLSKLQTSGEASVRLRDDLLVIKEDTEQCSNKLATLGEQGLFVLGKLNAAKATASERLLLCTASEVARKSLRTALDEALHEEDGLLSELSAAEAAGNSHRRKMERIQKQNARQCEHNGEAARAVHQQQSKEFALAETCVSLQQERRRLEVSLEEGLRLEQRLFDDQTSLANLLAEIWQANAVKQSLEECLDQSESSSQQCGKSLDASEVAGQLLRNALGEQDSHNATVQARLDAVNDSIQGVSRAAEAFDLEAIQKTEAERQELRKTREERDLAAAQATALKSQYEGLKGRLAESGSVVERLQGEISSLDASSADLEKLIARLENTIEEQKKRINCTIS